MVERFHLPSAAGKMKDLRPAQQMLTLRFEIRSFPAMPLMLISGTVFVSLKIAL